MTSTLIPSKGFSKRQSLRDKLDRVQSLDDDARNRKRFELMEELEEDIGKAPYFRWGAPATQKRQGTL